MSFSARRLRGSGLAVAVEGALTPDRAEDNWRIELRSEELHRHIHPADIDEPLRPKLIPSESIPIRLQRFFSINAGHQVAPMRRRHNLLGNRLEVEDIERIGSFFKSALLKGFGDRRNCC